MALTFQAGSFPDVVAVPTGVALVKTLNGGTTIQAELFTTSQTPTVLWTYTIAGAFIRFLRCAADPVTGEVRAIFQYNNGTDQTFIAAASGVTALGINVAVPERGICLTYESGDFVAYIVTSKFTYVRYPLAGAPSAPIANPFPVGGDLLGMRDVIAAVVQWDQSITTPGTYDFVTFGGQGFYHYNTRGTVTVGQTKGPPQTAEGILAWDGSAVSVLTTIQGYNPHLAIVTAGIFAGQAIVVWRTVDVSITLPDGQVVTANSGFATGLTGSNTNGLSNLLSGLYRIPVLERQGGTMSLPWYNYFVRQANNLATPINLGSNQVTGVLPGSNVDPDLDFIITDLGLLTGLVGDVEAQGPGDAEATIVRQYVPMTTGAIPGQILFVGADVMLVKVNV